MIVTVEGKKFSTGLDWHSYPLEQDAKDKLKSLKNKGLFANYVKVNKRLYQVYSCEKDERMKYPPLALGFLHLAGGYYYMNLPEGVWVLLKGADGSVIFERIFGSIEEFEMSEQGTLSNILEDGQEKREITPELMRVKRAGGGVDKKILALGGLLPVLALVVFYLFKPQGESQAPKGDVPAPVPAPAPAPISEPVMPQEPQPQEPQNEPLPPEEKVMLAKVDLSCYKEYYRQAVLTGKGSCNSEAKPDIPLSEALIVDCDRALKLIAIPMASVEWGQSQNYGEVVGYSFSIKGQIYMQDLKRLNSLYFKALSLKLDGEIQNLSTEVSGEVICKKENT